MVLYSDQCLFEICYLGDNGFGILEKCFYGVFYNDFKFVFIPSEGKGLNTSLGF